MCGQCGQTCGIELATTPGQDLRAVANVMHPSPYRRETIFLFGHVAGLVSWRHRCLGAPVGRPEAGAGVVHLTVDRYLAACLTNKMVESRLWRR
jgi:hypothetical protein